MRQYFSFQWHITDDCDQRCKHCYIFSENNCKKLDSMSWEQMQDAFYNCLDFCKVYQRIKNMDAKNTSFPLMACVKHMTGFVNQEALTLR